MKILILGVLALSLAGCATMPQAQPVIVHRTTVLMPPEALFDCPALSRYPDPAKLTDIQVAEILNKLDSNNRTCRKSVIAIRNYLKKAKSSLEK